MTDKQNSMNVNKHVLTQDLNLRQYSNTAIFLRDRLFVLSPSAQNQHNWFDLSKVNVDRYQEKQYKGFLVVRFFDKLLVADLDRFIREMMPSDKYVLNSSGRPHWKFRIKVSGSTHFIINHQNSTKAYPVREFSVKQLQELVNK
ncbi:hypothetical protein AC739_10470 [Planococcus glaciei]|uniref:hypothetical protein n=1 Tax=Planococcus glaciei TaxID=459472 RepID=UPI00069E9F87|nr:hypothetical protein [Planococcus glaciei]KOF10169.1 hypothetical protein AC739_10470 [Planococcus glaciei]